MLPRSVATYPMPMSEGLSEEGQFIRLPTTPWRAPLEDQVDSGWQTMVKQVRDELRDDLHAQGSAQSKALREQASALRQEIMSHRTAQSRIFAEQAAAIRQEAELSVRAERDARLWESAELRAAVEKLQARVAQCQAHLASYPSLLGEQNQFYAMQGAALAGQRQGAFEELAHELEAERDARCARDADLHARLGREVSDLARRLEEHRVALAEEIAEAVRRVDQHRSKLERTLERECTERGRESNELRAILDSVWQRATGGSQSKDDSSKYILKMPYQDGSEDRGKEVTGGHQEDVNTLYEMVREALGDTVHLRQQIAEVRQQRTKDQQGVERLERLERQVNTLQALLRAETPSARSVASTAASEMARSQGTLKLEDTLESEHIRVLVPRAFMQGGFSSTPPQMQPQLRIVA